MSDPSDKSTSVTEWIAGLKSGDSEAADRLWGKYFDQLVRLAKRRLGSAPRRIADEEDVAISVFNSLCNGAKRGRFKQLTTRADLWCLLMAITRQKAVDQLRRNGRQKRGGGQVRGDSIFVAAGEEGRSLGFDELAGSDPTPEFLATLNEEHERMLDQLGDDTLRKIAAWRMEGYTNSEMAAELGVSPGTVERKLRLIRSKWERELN